MVKTITILPSSRLVCFAYPHRSVVWEDGRIFHDYPARVKGGARAYKVIVYNPPILPNIGKKVRYNTTTSGGWED